MQPFDKEGRGVPFARQTDRHRAVFLKAQPAETARLDGLARAVHAGQVLARPGPGRHRAP